MGEKGYLYTKLMASKTDYIFNIDDHAFKTINDVRKRIETNYPIPNTDCINADVVKPFNYPSNIEVLEEVMIKGKKRKVRRDKYLGRLDSLSKLESRDYIATCKALNCFVHGRKGSTRPVEGKTYRVLLGENGEELGEHYTRTIFYGEKMITYKYPKFTDAFILEKFNLIRTKGYYGKKEFYQPTYDKKSIDDAFPDYRNTLYWNSSIITNKKGEASVVFYCSDINTKFIGNIEGVGGQGLLGTSSFEFIVRKIMDGLF